MYLENLQLKFYRNYDCIKLDLKKGINILIGKNAQGKTNLLESIYFLSTTKSHRIIEDNVLINKEKDFAQIIGILKQNEFKTKLDIIITPKEKKYKINDNRIKATNDYISKFKCIIFYPDDLELIKATPEVRRKYLNVQISQLYNSYNKILNDYNKLLKTRNDYLYKIRNNLSYSKQYFEILNDYYIKKSVLIFITRYKYICKINEYIDDIFFDIMGKKGLKIKYKPIINIVYFDKDNLYNLLKKINEEKFEEEINYGKSIYGPHRDDFLFELENDNLKILGSQGQQRCAVLSFKLSEFQIIKKIAKDDPILLLDDVFSEFDNIKKENLLKYVKNTTQVIITTNNLSDIDEKIVKKAKIYEIEEGKIKKGDKNGK